MGRLAMVAALFLAPVVSPVAAEDWQRLADDEIAEVLTSHVLVYDGGITQDFRSSGRTLYTAGEPSWGYWRVQNGRYCSQWPPSATWDCYDVAFDGVATVRFIDDWGNVSDGVFQE